jgi:hypothetical protein
VSARRPRPVPGVTGWIKRRAAVPPTAAGRGSSAAATQPTHARGLIGRCCGAVGLEGLEGLVEGLVSVCLAGCGKAARS